MNDYVVYRSFATDPRDMSSHVVDILGQSLRNNPDHGVTGFLHMERGRFYQYLEGPKAGVDGLMEKLKTDWRHHGMDFCGSGQTDIRLFEGWDMGFASANNRFLRSATGDRNQARPDADEIIRFLLSLAQPPKPTTLPEPA